MGSIKAIRTEHDYEAALARIDVLMDASPGSPEEDELDVLADLVEHYEEKEVPMGHPSALEAIRFRMEQGGLSPRDLIPFLGSRAKVSEVLAGKRPLTLAAARALHEHLGIPAEVLLRAPESPPGRDLDPRRFPVPQMVKLGWLPRAALSVKHAGRHLSDLVRRAGASEVAALYRKNNSARSNSKSDPYALQAWCWQVLALANERRPKTRFRKGSVNPAFLRAVARLSAHEDGPKRAAAHLAAHGIPFVAIPHLDRTYLDGAALQLADGTPVIALSLRYDRLDSFWFSLLHELAHVARHLRDRQTIFVDDLSLPPGQGGSADQEAEADALAAEALIPARIWEESAARAHPSTLAVAQLAQELHVHPAVVAGRVRFERKNFRMLSHFVGTGEVRRQFWGP